MSGFAGLRLLKKKKHEQSTSDDFVKICEKGNGVLVAGLGARIGDSSVNLGVWVANRSAFSDGLRKRYNVGEYIIFVF
ncbi:hypothetical protein A2392_02730 [Candidatus Kaiserbacteria bacterium RIFOXYB1_FULL_46_14]|uniref:Uncharacterized protein n=1 Tax=Candidatus Kaiserbacteria bacterium RIFOXYB1_FULL_46_14 TaxID=1798531 RepID=A0A1F6FIJ5_9BACT|nr:MAG: hypothetical protein A2392_02730 [Candidatus Kaiserbacteria bacterium RIFOXYB1_FULL_46_14]